MPQIDPKERFNARMNEPFVPLDTSKISMSTSDRAALRIANSMEYIAAQLGQINAKLDRLLPTEPDDKS